MSRFLTIDGGHIRPMDDPSGPEAAMGFMNLAGAGGGLRSRADSHTGTTWNTFGVSMGILAMSLGAVASRIDALDGDAAGMFDPQDLTTRFQTILEQPMPPLNAIQSGTNPAGVFPASYAIRPGDVGYRIDRVEHDGQAVVYRGGSGADVPEVGIARHTTQAPVVYFVSKASVNYLEGIRGNAAGLDSTQRKLFAAKRVHGEIMNRWAWEGSAVHGVYGLINHPYIDTGVSQVAYGPGTDADDIQADVSYWANYAQNESKQTYQPDTMVLASKLHSYLTTTFHSDGSGDTLMDRIRKSNPHITRVSSVHELNDKGGDGVHIMAFTRGGTALTASARAEVAMDPTMLPAEIGALNTSMYLISGFGGLNQIEVGNNLVVYVEMNA